MKLLLFSNLYPSSVMPLHGSFVRERMDRLARHLGCEYTVVRPVPRYPPFLGPRTLRAIPEHETVDGVVVHSPRYRHLPAVGVAGQARRMRRGARAAFFAAVERERPRLIDAQYLYPDACSVIPLAREAGIPCVATARGTDVNVLARLRSVRSQLTEQLPRADRLVAVSHPLAIEMAAVTHGDLESVAVCPNGVDTTAFRPASGPAERRVITVGRLVPGKRQRLLIEALASESGRAIPELVLVGDGPDRGTLEALAGRLEVHSRVRFTGELDRKALAAELARGGVFAFPSVREGWPNAVLEALACGLGVVACPVGGVPEMLGGFGELLPLDAAADEWGRQLTARLERAGDATVREAAVARASNYTWERCIAKISQVYEACLA